MRIAPLSEPARARHCVRARWQRVGASAAVLLALASVAALLVGCATRAAAPDPLGNEALDPPFYRVTAPDGQTLHILGSIHVGPSGGWVLPAHVEREFSAAVQLVFEVEEVDPMYGASVMIQLARLPVTTELKTVIGSQLYAPLRTQFEQLGGHWMLYDDLEPWVVTLELARLQFAAAGFQATDGVDVGLMARRHPVPRIGLETIEEQLRLFDSQSLELQIASLRSTLEEGAEIETLVDRMLHAWAAGDDGELAALLLSFDERYPELEPFYEEIFEKRNHRMAEGLHDLVQRGGGQFVTLGAGHVVGAESVPLLLERRGYTIERLRPAAAAGD